MALRAYPALLEPRTLTLLEEHVQRCIHLMFQVSGEMGRERTYPGLS
jgi:hypothetical protein